MSNQAYQESFYSASGPSDPGILQNALLQGHRPAPPVQPIETGYSIPQVDQAPSHYPSALNNPSSQWHDTVTFQQPQLYPVNITNYSWNNMTAYGSDRTNVNTRIPGAFPTQPNNQAIYQNIPAAYPVMSDDNTSFRQSMPGAFPDLPENYMNYHEGFPPPLPPQPGDNGNRSSNPYGPTR